jgi:peptide chain release factor 3
MDRAHRDRVAFFRVCSGRYERGMKVQHTRLERDIRLNNPVQFLAQERTLIEEGFAGDIIGVFDPGIFLIGDTICSFGSSAVEPLPSSAGQLGAWLPDPSGQAAQGPERSRRRARPVLRAAGGREGRRSGRGGQSQRDVVKHPPGSAARTGLSA